ncbi:MAG: hypothetical protein JWN63_1269 [Candidatus Acidoferrum typicum]|nr:hypothetical protein [Candidatus Acidoferrum typicum]
MTSKTQFNIFISHINEEKKVAGVLKQWFEALFPGHLSAFVSSDYDDIPLGKKWLAAIESAMDRAVLLVVLVSPTSFGRMWIHLEVGWALGRKIEVVPICLGELVADRLPRPYSDFNGVNVMDDEFAERLVASLKTRLGFRHPVPVGMYQEFAKAVRAASKAALSGTAVERSGSVRPEPAAPTAYVPHETEMKILRFLVEVHNQGPTNDVSIEDMASRVNISPARASVDLKQLETANFVHYSLIMGVGKVYSISDEGLTFMASRGEI